MSEIDDDKLKFGASKFSATGFDLGVRIALEASGVELSHAIEQKIRDILHKVASGDATFVASTSEYKNLFPDYTEDQRKNLVKDQCLVARLVSEVFGDL